MVTALRRTPLLWILAALIVAIAVGILVWHHNADKRVQQTVQDVTGQPVQRQDAPVVPVTDSPVPPTP